MWLFRKTLFILLCFVQFTLVGQNTEFLSFPDFDISISPSVPKICPGQITKITCNEDYDSYEWEGVGFEFQAFGKQVDLSIVGQYTLTIKGEIDDTQYFKILNFITQPKDLDGDGVCDQNDCLPKNPFIGEGLECDDGNPCTVNDVFNQECKCIGSRIPDCKDSLLFNEDPDYSKIENSLTSVFYSTIQESYDDTLNLKFLINEISSIPFAYKLLQEDIKKAIYNLSSSDIIDLFSDINNSRYSPEYIGNNLEDITDKTIKSWQAISTTPILFRSKTTIQDSVSIYMIDTGKSANDIENEITSAKKGHQWWFHYVLGRLYWTPFLDNMSDIKAFATEIIEFNKLTQGQGNILSGSPMSAINTSLYFDDVLEQGASIFKIIVKNHMFYDGNKRTAAASIKSFMLKAGIPINKSDKKFFKLAKKVATDQIVEVPDLANKLIK